MPTRVVVAVGVAGAAVAWWPSLNDSYALPKATVVVAAGLLAVATLALELLRRPVVEVGAPRFLWLLLALAGAVVVTTVVGEAPLLSLVGARQRYAGAAEYLACLALCAAIAVRFDERAVRLLAWSFVVAGAVVAAYAFVQWSAGDEMRSTLGNVDFVAGWLAVALPLACWAALSRRHRDEAAVLGGVTTLVVAVVLARVGAFQGVVAGAAGAAVVGGAWSVERGWHRAMRRGHVVGGALVLVVAAVLLAPHLRRELDDGLRERRLIWAGAVDDALDRPLLGHGLDSFSMRWYRVRPAEHAERYPELDAGAAHDVPLDMAISGGVLLLSLYLAVVLGTGRRLVRGLRQSSGEQRLLLAAVGGAWVAYQVQSLVSLEAPALVLSHWVLTGAVVAMTTGARRARVVPRAVAGLVAAVTLAAIVPVLRPLRAESHLSAALAAERRGDPRAAIEHLHAAADLAPWAAVYRSYLAVRLPAEDALPFAVRAAELAPGDPYAASTAADTGAAAGDAVTERRWRAAAVRDDPRNPRWRGR